MKNNKINNVNPYVFSIFIFILLGVVLNIDKISKHFLSILGILSPIFIGLAIAFILNIIMGMWEKFLFKKHGNTSKNRILSLLLSLFTIAMILFVVLRLVLPQLSDSINEFISRFPTLYNKFRSFLLNNTDSLPYIKEKIMRSSVNGEEIILKLSTFLSSFTSNFLSIVNTFFGVITNLVMGFILAIYLVIGKNNLIRQFDLLFRKILPKKVIDKLYYVFDVTNTTFKAFFTGQFIEAIILGVLCTLGMFVLSMPFAPMIGSFIAITSLIPMLGAYIGGAFGFLMIATQSFPKAVLFVVFLVVLQQIEGNLIYPRVVGKSVGLPGLWILVSIIVGGGLFGINGIFFGVPITATVYKILKEYVHKDF